MGTDAAPSDLIRSVSRALRLLEEVGTHPEGVNPKRLASRCGIRLATVYHLLRTLRYEGYLERLASGDYVLGPEIAGRFRDLQSTLAHRPPVTAVVRDLAAVTGHSTYLARFVAGRVTITGVAEASGSPPLEDLIVGFNEGAHATALGKALLSTLDQRSLARYLRDTGMRPFTRYTITERADLASDLHAYAERGLFAETEQYRRGVGCVATLIRRGDDGWWALGMSYRTLNARGARRALTTALRQAADDLAVA